MAIDLDKIWEMICASIALKNQIEASINEEKDAKRRKKLWKASQKALKTGKDSDLAIVRKRLFHH